MPTDKPADRAEAERACQSVSNTIIDLLNEHNVEVGDAVRIIALLAAALENSVDIADRWDVRAATITMILESGIARDKQRFSIVKSTQGSVQ